MVSDCTSTIAASESPKVVLQSFGREGERGRRLRSQLAARFPGRSREEIEDAVQTACRSFLTDAEGISEPGRINNWIRTAAYHALLRELEHLDWERATDPIELGSAESVAEEADPAEDLIALEDEADLGVLIREVAESLPERRLRVLALWCAGRNRPEIAARLGLSERVVKRDLRAIMDEARVVVAREAGGGCLAGEPQVLQLAYGLASSVEAAQARLHLDRCRRCSALIERLEAWREKAGAVLPVPAAETISPGLVERIFSRGAHTVGSLKRHILGGGAELKQQVAAGAFSRTVDPTPLAGVRPGAVAAVVVGCIAVGGGTYCAQRGVDPIGAAEDLIAGTQEGEPSPPPSGESTEPVPSVAAPPTVTEEAPVSQQPAETAPAPETTYTPEPQPEPEPEPEPTTPPPEASFEPSAPVSPPSTDEVAEPATESAPAVSPKPAPAPSGDAPQFGGP